MTIIVYSKGQLAADTRALQGSSESNTYDYFTAHSVTKLKLLARGTLAVAVSGSVPTQTQWNTIQDIFLRNIIVSEMIIKEPKVFLDKQEAKQINSRNSHFVVLSKNHAYFVAAEEKDSTPIFARIDTDLPLAYGSGSRAAYMALKMGKSAKQAAEFACDIEATCSYPINSISQKDLIELNEITFPIAERRKLFSDFIRNNKAELEKEGVL